MHNAPHIALVLTGGGARGAYQAGFLRGLAEVVPEGIAPFSILTGVSVGAINAAYLACAADDFRGATQSLWDMWSNLKPEGVFIPKRRALLKNGLHWLSRFAFPHRSKWKPFTTLLDNQPLRELLTSQLDFTALSENVRKRKIRGVSFSTTDYTHGNSITFFDGAEDIQDWERGDLWGRRTNLGVDHVVASVGLPVLFEPVRIGNCYYGDGSTRLNAPLSPAIRLGAEKILAITMHRHKYGRSKHEDDASVVADVKPPSLGAIMVTILQSAFSDTLDSDLDRLNRINRFAEVSEGAKDFRRIPALEMQPSQDLGKLAQQFGPGFSGSLSRLLSVFGASGGEDHEFQGYLSFDKSYIGSLLEAGYKDALDAKAQLQSFLKIP